MILATRYAGNVAMRSGVIGDSTPPSRLTANRAWSGVQVDVAAATGLASYGAAIRLISTTIATFELGLYQGEGAKKTLVETGWLADLFDYPWSEGSCFDWLSDIAVGPEGHGNTFLQKMKNRRGQVVELVPVDPELVRVRRLKGVKVFDVLSIDDRKWSTLTPSEILHVRGFSIRGFLSGFSPVAMHRDAIGNSIGLSEFQGRFFSNDARPGVVISVPGKVDREQARLMLDIWESDHAGLSNAHKPALLWNGATVIPVPVSMTDAQFIEANHYGVLEIARITGVPASLLDAGTTKTPISTEQDWLRFMRMCVYPRSRRILQALMADRDLFPYGSEIYPAFEYDAVLAVDAATQALVDKEHVQSGILLVDEVRGRKGLGPLPPVPADWALEPGKIPQITPVGGAPAPLVGTGKATGAAPVPVVDASIPAED